MDKNNYLMWFIILSKLITSIAFILFCEIGKLYKRFKIEISQLIFKMIAKSETKYW